MVNELKNTKEDGLYINKYMTNTNFKKLKTKY